MIIYKITSKTSGKPYVGMTTLSLERRWNAHVRNAFSSKPVCKHFASAIRLYGPHDFVLEILQECSSVEELKAAEIKWIEKLQSFENGYNMTLGGDGVTSESWTPEMRARLSRSHKGKILTQEHCQRISAEIKSSTKIRSPRKPISIEDRKKLSEAGKKAWADPQKRAAILSGHRKVKRVEI